jgi:anti-sigma factor RsiW
MNCNEYENLITQYLENTASPSQRIQMESHISECGKCRTMMEQEKSVIEHLDGINIEPCPDDIIDNVMNLISGQNTSLKEHIRSWFNTGRSMRYGFAPLAGSLIIVLLALILYVPGQRRQPMERIQYSSEEIQKATVEARLALAYFAVYSRKAETALKNIDFTEPVIKPIEGEFKKVLSKFPYI